MFAFFPQIISSNFGFTDDTQRSMNQSQAE